MNEAGPTPAPGATPRRPDWLDRGVIAGVLLLVGWFYVWTARSNGDPWNFGRKQRDYYNLLIDGYRAGQLSMKVEVPDALLKLPDPYDPRRRPPGLGLHDASFYKGKYYLYFGVAPVLTLMLPFRLLTGVDLPQPVATLIFVYGGFLASVATWLAIRRRYFPMAGTWLAALCVLALGLAGLGPLLLRRPHLWELPIGAGYCFAMLTLFFVFRSLHSHRRVAWLAAAGLGLGLAIASRLTYLPAILLLGVPLIFWWRAERRMPGRAALAAAIPLAVIGGLLALHNYLRFDDPFQFGQAYQLSLDYEAKQPHFGAHYLPYNLWAYFFSVAAWSRYFPFIGPVAGGPPVPAGYAILGNVYGLLVNLPLAACAPLALLGLWRRDAADRSRLSVWLGAATTLFVSTAGFMLFFFSALPRYMLDFAPALMLLGTVGVLAGDGTLRRKISKPILVGPLVRIAGAGVMGFSALFGVLFSLRVDDFLAERNPREFRELARMFNHLPAKFERLMGVHHGALELNLRFAPAPVGTQEVIMTVGAPGSVERILVRRVAGASIQLVFRPVEGVEQVTRPLALDLRAAHRLRIELGAMLPPETHPLFANMAAPQVSALTRRVRLDFDGETVLDGWHVFPAPAPGTVKIGREISVDAPDARFSGDLVAVRRDEAGTLEAEKSAAFVRMRLSFPAGAAGSSEPLVSIGDPLRALVVFARPEEDGRMIFGWDESATERGETGPVVVDRTMVHEVVVRLWETADSSRQRVQLRLEGTLLFSREIPCVGAAIVAGRSLVENPRCAAAFSGRLHAVDQSPDGADPLLTRTGPIKLSVILPQGREGARQPLIATGSVGAADFLCVEYVDRHAIRFALDHWGSAMVRSEAVRLDFEQPHKIEIATVSLDQGPNSEAKRAILKGRLRVKLDGQVVWETTAEFFRFEPEDLTIGRNVIGGTSCDAVFSGSVLRAARGTDE